MKKILFIILLTIPFIGLGQGWENTFGGNNEEEGMSVQQTNDGGYIISGSTNSFGNGYSDIYLIKTDGSGTEQWTKTFGGTESDNGYSVQQTNDGGYIICGETSSFGNGDDDVYVIKTDGNGIEQWSKTFGGISDDKGFSLDKTTDGGYIITGRTGSYSNDDDVFLIKTDSQGDSLWIKIIGIPDYGCPEEGFSVKEISVLVGSIYVAGVLLQYPVGLISDRTDRRMLIIFLASFR